MAKLAAVSPSVANPNAPVAAKTDDSKSQGYASDESRDDDSGGTITSSNNSSNGSNSNGTVDGEQARSLMSWWIDQVLMGRLGTACGCSL